MKNQIQQGPGPVHATPTPVDPVSMEFQVMEDRIAALRERVTVLEEIVRGFAPHEHGHPGPGGRPVIAGFVWGPVISAPASQDVIVCNWDAVMVIVSRPDWGFGTGATPVAGATVKFSITNSTGTTGPQISSGPNGTGTVAGAGGTVRVTTDAQGQAFIYVHDSAAGKITLNADTGGAWSQDIIINFR